MKTLVLDGCSLELAHLLPVFRGEPVSLSIADSVRPGVAAARAMVEEHVRRGDAVYGLTTGFGRLKSVAIQTADLAVLQRNLVLSHCAGVGEPMPAAEVRAAQILRLNGLVRGHSGVRMEVLEFLVRAFNRGFVPIVPQQGSVGASGDLAPLAHMAAAYMGVGEVWVGGERLDAAEGLARIGEQPLCYSAKEGLALINGTEIMKAVGAGVFLRAVNLSKAADVLASLTIEALKGSLRPFDQRIAALKRHEGHARTAANVRACLQESEVLASHASCGRIQDPYSLRCVPEVHGAYKAALQHVGEVLGEEINAVTDNPVLFPLERETISAGLFHGQPVAMVLDYLALALCSLANISERRVEQLVNPDLSGLPAFLSAEPGLNSGLMIAQVAAASLASENKSLAHPASVDSIPTSANLEDHVSMGVTAARKARAICANTEAVLGIELICAAQAREFALDLRAGRGAQRAFDLLRERVEPFATDRYLHPDLEEARELLVSGRLVDAVEAEIGPLLA